MLVILTQDSSQKCSQEDMLVDTDTEVVAWHWP
jgi:hypothetical protein